MQALTGHFKVCVGSFYQDLLTCRQLECTKYKNSCVLEAFPVRCKFTTICDRRAYSSLVCEFRGFENILCNMAIPIHGIYQTHCMSYIRASVDALCRDGAGITCLGKASKLGAPGDISLLKHLTKLYQLYSS